MNEFVRSFRSGTVLLAAGMFLILAVMMVPVPTGLLDLIITFNIAFALTGRKQAGQGFEAARREFADIADLVDLGARLDAQQPEQGFGAIDHVETRQFIPQPLVIEQRHAQPPLATERQAEAAEAPRQLA